MQGVAIVRYRNEGQKCWRVRGEDPVAARSQSFMGLSSYPSQFFNPCGSLISYRLLVSGFLERPSLVSRSLVPSRAGF